MSSMARGEPGLPGQFDWRGTRHTVSRVVRRWKTSTAELGEMYLRRHWYRIVTSDGTEMSIYCERQTKNLKKPKARWWVYTLHKTGE